MPSGTHGQAGDDTGASGESLFSRLESWVSSWIPGCPPCVFSCPEEFILPGPAQKQTPTLSENAG